MKEQGLIEFNDEQIALLNWIDGIIRYNHTTRNIDAVSKLVDKIETNKTASIKSTLSINDKTYVFEIRLAK